MEAMLFPTSDSRMDEVKQKIVENAQSFFEEIWLQRALKSLAGVSAIDASGHPTYRKRLLGVLRFMEDCFLATAPQIDGTPIYDFGRLRRKLGLGGSDAPSLPASVAGPKIDELSVAELAGLESAQLSNVQLDQAFRASLLLDARDLAGKFARLAVDRPVDPAIPDRYSYFNHLIQLAQAENDIGAVMTLLDEAGKADLDSNEGRRQGDFSLRRAQIHAKRGEVQTAYEVLKNLLASNLGELKYDGPAIEAMLGQKKGAWALEFAETGLVQRRSQNNRDSEQYFMELSEAARKQIGS